MTYLGIDIRRALGLAQLLRHAADQLPAVEDLTLAGESESELSTGCVPLLDQLRLDLHTTARITQAAAMHLLSYQFVTPWGTAYAPHVEPPSVLPGANATAALRLQELNEAGPHGAGTPVGVPVRWDDPDSTTAWDDVHQDASHNSYKVDGGIAALYANGVRAFELDIHRGAPTNFAQRPEDVVEDVFDHEGGVPDDWQVYHFSGDHHSEYKVLRDGLAAVAALNSDEPLTVFIDNKNAFGGTHQPATLDALVVEAFGDRLFGPDDLLARAPGASTLNEAVDQAGWPSASELESNVIVVLTDKVELYPSGSPSAQVFLSVSPTFSGSATDVTHIPDPNVVVYNVSARDITPEQIAAVSATGGLLRTYENSDCPDPARGMLPPTVNYRAIDVDGDDDHCPAPSPGPTPKPGPGD